jgi:hypothetical protein
MDGGLDFKPPQMPRVTAKLTYYDIVFKDQITTADASVVSAISSSMKPYWVLRSRKSAGFAHTTLDIVSVP